MDPTVQAMLDAMKDQLEKFMTALSTLTKSEAARPEHTTSTAPKFDSFDVSKERW